MLFFNRVAQFTATTGQGTITLGTVSANNMLTFADAGAADGNETTYLIEDGDNFEIGHGTIGGGVTTLARDTVLISKEGGIVGTDKLELTGSARVRGIESAEDLNEFVAKAGQFTALPESVKTAGWTLTAADAGGLFVYNAASGGTVALPAVASADSDVYWFKTINTGALTIDPNSTELIEGLSTLVLPRYAAAMIWPNEGKTAWRAIVFPAIVGTVMQSGGVPTGSILEYGSNANGHYIRYADGTQICWDDFVAGGATSTQIASTQIYRSAGHTATFAAAFAAVPAVAASVDQSPRWGTAYGATTTNVSLMAFYISSPATVINFSYIAIGRWY